MDIDNLYKIESFDWPEDAEKIIRDTLTDKKTAKEKRILAAELAADDMILDDNMAETLLEIVNDDNEPEELRCAAVETFGPALSYNSIYGFRETEEMFFSEKKFNDIKKTLRDLFYDVKLPKTLRRRILEADASSPMNWHKEAIKKAYESCDEEWILSALFCMGYVKGFKKQILESLNSNNPEILYEAVCAAGNASLKEAWPTIKEILSSPQEDKMLLISAISAAAFVNPDEAEDLLTQHSGSDDEEISEAAQEALLYFVKGYECDDDETTDDLDEDSD